MNHNVSSEWYSSSPCTLFWVSGRKLGYDIRYEGTVSTRSCNSAIEKKEIRKRK